MLHATYAPTAGPFRSPEWRWSRAVWLHANQRRICRRDDARVRQAVRFARELLRGDNKVARERLSFRYPAFFAAHALYVAEPTWRRWELEARLLTCEPFGEVAGPMRMGDEVVAIYHDIFFDVRTRLKATDWVWSHVLGREARVGMAESDVGRLLKLYGYHGDTVVLDSLVDFYRDPPIVPERPELLDPKGFGELCNKLIIESSILGRVTNADDPRAVKRLAILRQATDQLRRAAETVQRGSELPQPVDVMFDFDARFAASTGVNVDVTRERHNQEISPDARGLGRSTAKVA
jgi:hypothetical protein